MILCCSNILFAHFALIHYGIGIGCVVTCSSSEFCCVFISAHTFQSGSYEFHRIDDFHSIFDIGCFHDHFPQVILAQTGINFIHYPIQAQYIRHRPA